MSPNAVHVWYCAILTIACAALFIAFVLVGSILVAGMFIIPLAIGAFATGLWYATWYIEGDGD